MTTKSCKDLLNIAQNQEIELTGEEALAPADKQSDLAHLVAFMSPIFPNHRRSYRCLTPVKKILKKSI